jgi:sulfate transport system permease protein
VVLPAIQHGLEYGVILTLARSLGEFGAVAVIGGGVQGVTETATLYVYRSLQDRNNIDAYSIALLLGLIAVAILFVMNRLRTDQKGG